MSEIKTVYKNVKPLKQGDIYFFPLTTYDQILMPDGKPWDGIVTGGNNASAVLSVNTKTGVVTLDASDVHARPDTWIPAIDDIEGLRQAIEAAGAAGGVVSVNNVMPDETGNVTLDLETQLQNTSPAFNAVTADTITVGTIQADKVIGAVYE